MGLRGGRLATKLADARLEHIDQVAQRRANDAIGLAHRTLDRADDLRV